MSDNPAFPEEKFTSAVTNNDLINPFAEETSALKSRAPSELLSHEKVRLNRLNSFNSLFHHAAPQYKVAAMKGEWGTTAAIASKVLQAAKSLTVGAMLLMFLFGRAGAQSTLPAAISDPNASENFEYLDQQLRSLQTSVANLSVSSATATVSTAPVSAIGNGQPTVIPVFIGTSTLGNSSIVNTTATVWTSDIANIDKAVVMIATAQVRIGNGADFADLYGPHTMIVSGPDNSNVEVIQDNSGGLKVAMFIKNGNPVPFQWGTITQDNVGFFTNNGEPQMTLWTNKGVSFGTQVNGNHGTTTPPASGILVQGDIVSSGTLIVNGQGDYQYNLKFYSGQCDDSTDDYPAMVNMLTAAGNQAASIGNRGQYVSVYVPPGVCLFSSSFTIPSGIRFKTDGLLLYTGTTSYAPTITVSTGVYVDQLLLNAGGSNGVQFGTNSVDSDSFINNLNVFNVGYASAPTGGRLNTPRYQACASFYGFGFHANNLECVGGGAGFYLGDADDFHANVVNPVASVRGVVIEGSSGIQMDKLYIDSPQYIGLQVDASRNLNLNGSSWENNTSYNYTPAYGVMIGSNTFEGDNQVNDAQLNMLLIGGATAFFLNNSADSRYDLTIGTGPLYTQMVAYSTVAVQYGPGNNPNTMVDAVIGSGITPYTGTIQGALKYSQNGTINLSTTNFIFGLSPGQVNGLTTALAAIGASSAAAQTALTSIGASSAAAQTALTALGLSTNTIQVNVGASTGSLQVQVNNIALATATIATSTGNLLSQMYNVGRDTEALNYAVKGPWTAKSSVTAQGGIQAQGDIVMATNKIDISTSGHITFPSITSPACSQGRVYFDSTQNGSLGALMLGLDSGLCVPIATGTLSGGSVITGSGSSNTIPKFTAAQTLGNSGITDDGTNVRTNESVGIGAVPSSTLTVNGIVFSNNSLNPSFMMNSAGANYGMISNVGTGIWSLGYGPNIGTPITSVLAWNGSGQVGVGTTGPGTPLEVDSATPEIRLKTITTTGGPNGVLSIYGNGGSGNGDRNWGLVTEFAGFGDMAIAESANASGAPQSGSARMYFSQGGNVGVGTTSPGTTKLYVLADGNSFATSATLGGNGYWQFISGTVNTYLGAASAIVSGGSSSDYAIGGDSGGMNLILAPGGATRVYVKNTGSVGVQTAAPSDGLHVSSSAMFTGNITVGDNVNGGMQASAQYYTWAKSLDNITQSSGTTGVIAPITNTAPGSGAERQIWTTTTTVGTGQVGILMDGPCAPNSICRIGIHGKFWAQVDGSGCSKGQSIVNSGTRGRIACPGVFNTGISGLSDFTVGANLWEWITLW